MKRILVLAGIAAVLFIASSAPSWIVRAEQGQAGLFDGRTPAAYTATPQPYLTATSPASYGGQIRSGCCGMGGRMGGMMGSQSGGQTGGMMQNHPSGMSAMGDMAHNLMNEIGEKVQGYMHGMMGSTSTDMPHGGMMEEMAPVHEDVAMLFGMTTQDLYQKMGSGMSLAQIAAEKGMSEQQLMDGIMAGRRAAYDQAVMQGYMSQAQADTRLQAMRDNLQGMVNRQGNGTNSWGMMWEWEYGMQTTPQPAP